MLLNQATLAGIAGGTIVAVFRRWREPRVQAGSTLRTAVGVLAVDRIEPVPSTDALTDRSAREAGFASRHDLLAELARYPEGRLYRVSIRLAGPDPRIALRRQSRLTASEMAQLEQKLARLGAGSADGAWGLAVLRLIARRPAVRAADLARAAGMDTAQFKVRVRKLKDLGLTESLGVGYRVSPRGRAVLRRLARPGRATRT